MRNDIDKRKDEIISLLESGVPRLEVARMLNCKYDTLKSRLDAWGVKAKNQSRKGIPRPNEGYIPASEYLGTNKYLASAKLKEKLWREGIKEKKCERCGVEEWFGSYRHLELDHIDGQKYNNSLENLRILCANCHSLTPTNSGKNIGKNKKQA